MTTHFYAVFGLTPYGVWEIYRGRFRRLPCPKLIAGIIGVVCGCALCSTQILTSSRMTKGGSWSPPSIPVLTGIFSEIFPGSLFWLVCIMAVAVLFLNEIRPAGPMRNGERVSWFFLSIPFAGYLIAEVLTNFLYYRHFLLLLPGVAVGFACFIGRQFGANRKIAWGVLLLLGGFAIRSEVLTALHPERILYLATSRPGQELRWRSRTICWQTAKSTLRPQGRC